jgi:hypothetical protein
MAQLSWMDVQVSVVGFLLVFACVETVLAEYLNDHYSEMVSKNLDTYSRHAFPFAFFVVLTLAGLASGPDNVLGLDTSTLFTITLVFLMFFLVMLVWPRSGLS